MTDVADGFDGQIDIVRRTRGYRRWPDDVDNVQNLSHFSKRAVSLTLKEERGHEGRERRQIDGASHQDR